MKSSVNKFANSVLAICLGLGFSVAAMPSAYAADECITGFTLVGEACEKGYPYANGAASLKVPSGLGEFEIEAIGAAGGTGGFDWGGCVRAAGGQAGYLVIRYPDLSNKTISLYPGGKGADGANSATATGGGAGGTSLIAQSFMGGKGGNTGPIGGSGGGAGGGAATVVDVGSERFVAAGAGGGGGCAGSTNGSLPGTTNSSYESNSNGGVGLSTTTSQPRADGGGGGGGGGGILGGTGGLLFIAASGEPGGYGGNAGTNTPVGDKVAVSTYVSNTAAGNVIVRYFPMLGTKSLELVGENPSSANKLTFQLTLKSKRDFSAADVILSGSAASRIPLKVTITSPKPVKAPYTYTFDVTPKQPKTFLSGNLVATVFDVSSAPILVDAEPPFAQITLAKGNDTLGPKVFDVVFNERVNGLTKESFRLLQGTATNCSIGAPTGSGSSYRVTLTGCSKGSFGLVLKKDTVTDQTNNAGPEFDNSSGIVGISDIAPPVATIELQPNSLQTNSHVFDVRFDENVNGLAPTSFQVAAGTSKSCEIGYLLGSGNYFQVSLDKCTDGTFGIILNANSVTDNVGNLGPETPVASELAQQSTKATSVIVLPGQSPKSIEPKLVTSIFGSLDEATSQKILESGVAAPVAGAPTTTVLTDLTNATAEEQIQLASTHQVEVGSALRLSFNVSAEIAAVSDVVAFMETGDLWQYLGRASFTNNSVSSDEFTFAKLGDYKIRLAIVGKDVVTNMSLPTTSGFGQGLGRVRSAVGSDETLLSPQIVDLTLQAIAGPNGLPEVIGETTVPTTPGSQTDENAPSTPYDPLASPEGIKAVANSVGTAVVVAGAVAGAAAGAAAAGGSARSGSSGSSSSGSASSSQDTDLSDGSIESLDAEVESFTTAKISWGDKIPIFRFKVLTFLDKSTHDLTMRLAKFSPVVSKIVNDGAYLRSVLGSLWLAFPITGVALAVFALMQPAVELKPPIWQLFIAIAVLGMFDALSGMLATLIYSIGMISIFGISDLADVRLMLGVLLLGFGPALIAVSFRAIRKQFETSFAYLWDRLVDIAVLTFFISWSVASMVSTLPALAGRTLVVANHSSEFALFLAIAIAVRILLEELAARGFSKRLDTINPTEVPSTSQLQKVISTAVRLFLFIFVTAAFMGNVWQVWVGSFIFILPNILSWVQDKFPNSTLLWKLLPQGVPGLALTLIISGYSATLIAGWLEGNPEYPQYLFMLLPIPVFLLGLLGMFGREGKDDEDRPIMQARWRWVYRIGGIVVLAWTMQLAGVI